MPLWTLTQVSLRGSSRYRLESISLEIATGVTAVVGESGAGKSSLLGLLVGLDRPDSGSLVCHVKPVGDRLPVYWLPPGNGLWSSLTVREHLETVSAAGKTATARLNRLLSAFDLQGLLKSRPDDLSQGERSRLAMARALASEAQVLVLDEPLVHTSFSKNEAYWQIIREICREIRTSLVIATHDLSAIRREAEQIIILDQGQIAFAGDWRAGNPTPAHEIAGDLLRRIRSGTGD
jgi:ABC-type multidrug transport system ATPase subunit